MLNKKLHFKILLLFIFPAFLFSGCYYGVLGDEDRPEYVVAIHGGAGWITPENLSDEEEREATAKMQEALEAAEKVLKNEGHAVDAVEAAIHVLENSPIFNAGKGAVLTADGTVEMDASIMNGEDQNAGAIAGVKHIKNPISGARLVMEKSKHVMLAGQGADEYAAQNGLDTIANSYFITKERAEAFNKNHPDKEPIHKFGTVGCVALDSKGNLAAGTSTGGMSDKEYGRIGDSPIIGAGTYANNETVAVSATGHGEWFIRFSVAHDIHAMVDYKRWTVERASDFIIQRKLNYFGVNGGVIVLDKNGQIAMPFNTPGMYRGYLKSTGEQSVKLYSDDE